MLVAIVTVSDGVYRGARRDESGARVRSVVEAAGDRVIEALVVPDERPLIEEVLIRLADQIGVELVLTTGGTGLGPRDVTPEATRAVIEKEVPGIAEAMRVQALEKSPRAMLSRGIAGVRKRTLIVNLPGSPRGVEESLEIVYPSLAHAVALIRERPAGH